MLDLGVGGVGLPQTAVQAPEHRKECTRRRGLGSIRRTAGACCAAMLQCESERG